MKSDIYKILEEAGIYGPGSKELEKQEEHLIRYFEREYKYYRDNPVSLESLGISTNQGPMMEETKELMEHHYDERPEFFESFLDKKYHAYSMAYYGETPSDILNSPLTLEQAQEAKFSLVAERAQIKGNERILNIGCGFGSLETFLLRKFPDIEITGITPSKIQYEYIQNKIANVSDPHMDSNFHLMKCTVDDYFKSHTNHKYDLVISIGVMEHSFNIKKLMSNIDTVLNKNGYCFHHLISSIITIPYFVKIKGTNIEKYFPGGRILPFTEFPRNIGNLDLKEKWFINGLNYWRTLAEWHKRYWSNLDCLYGTIFNIDEIMHWNDYFSLSKAVFAPYKGTCYGNCHYLFRKQ